MVKIATQACSKAGKNHVANPLVTPIVENSEVASTDKFKISGVTPSANNPNPAQIHAHIIATPLTGREEIEGFLERLSCEVSQGKNIHSLTPGIARITGINGLTNIYISWLDNNSNVQDGEYTVNLFMDRD